MTTQTAPASTIVAVSITAAKHPRIRTLTGQCGSTFRYERHMEHRNVTSLLISCLCRHGHGPAHNPWRGWVSMNEAKMTLTDIAAPISSYTPATDAEIAADVADVLTLDRVGVNVPARRDDVATAA